MKLATAIGIILSVFFASSASAQNFAITGVTLRSDAGTRQNVTVVVRKNKITAIGTNMTLAKNVRVIDGTGKVLTAGLIAAGTRLGLVEIGAVGYTNEGSFDDAHPVHAAFSVTDGYNPDSMVIDVTRNGGITSTVSVPQGGLISGQSAWMTLAEGSVDDNLIKKGAALHITVGRQARGTGDGSRGHALQRLRALFDDATHYGKNRSAYDRGQTRPYGASHQDLEVLLTVLQRKMPVVVTVDRKSDIAAVLGLAKQYRIRVILQGATEAWMLAGELVGANVPVMLSPKANLPSSFDQIHVIDNAASYLIKAGVSVLLSPLEDASSARTLRQLAGLAVAHGLSWEQAFAAITTTPARVFGVDRGELKAGAVADMVLWSGDPLELSSRAELVIIGGVEQSMENHQTLLLKRYR